MVKAMIFINIDKNRHKGYLYKQIYQEIKKAILERKLRENDKLPSKRELADSLNVSVNTISHAYEQLLAEGYIYAIERSGFYVEKITDFTKIKTEKVALPEDLKETYIEREKRYSFSHMAADISLFPFHEWKKCQQRAIENHCSEIEHIPHHQGPYLVRKTIAELISLTRGVVCEPEQVVISVGTQPLVEQFVRMQQKHEPLTIAVEDPGYARMYRHLKQIGTNVEPVPLDEKGMDVFEVVKREMDVALVTPSHQFPMGMIMPISRRIELLNWAAERPNRYILEDDYDSEFKYDTDQIPSLQSLDQHQRVIYLGTFSKSLFPGLRISYMVLPIPLLRKYRKHYDHLIPYSNTINLYTLHYFIEDGFYHRHIKRMSNHYKAKRQLLIESLHRYFGHSVEIVDIPAGLHFVAHFKTEKSYEQVEEDAKKYKLEIYSMRRFMLNRRIKHNGKVTLVLGFATIDKDDIDEAVKRLYRVIHD